MKLSGIFVLLLLAAFFVNSTTFTTEFMMDSESITLEVDWGEEEGEDKDDDEQWLNNHLANDASALAPHRMHEFYQFSIISSELAITVPPPENV